jgi:XTP/dITP diphosphohydrolase
VAEARYTGGDVVVASHNHGKVQEISDLIGDYVDGLVLSAASLGLPEPEETGETFRANAEIKARAVAREGYTAIADDSGLVVPALGGAPGLNSARWAGPEKDFTIAMQRVHDELPADADRGARFVCALAMAWPDGRCITVEGHVDGTLVWPPRGTRGFGYDPIFKPAGYDITFGEMDPAEKHRISHRAHAFRRLVATCF